MTTATLLQCGSEKEPSSWLPTERVLQWVVELFGNAGMSGVRALRTDGVGPWLARITPGDSQPFDVVLRGLSHRIDHRFLATNAAALRFAEHRGLGAPRLLGEDLDGRSAGAPLTVESAVGSTCWPAPPTVERLRTAGAAIALIHATRAKPDARLPYRPRPIAVDDFATERRLGAMATTRLLDAADERVRAWSPPDDPWVFVHGDVWPGNLAWTVDERAIPIDWKTAGVGHPGVDLGELRKQVALHFGPEAPPHVLEGWQAEAGRPARDVAYWDVVAALNTPTSLSGWPAYDDQGAPLHSDGATQRRDAFLTTALDHL